MNAIVDVVGRAVELNKPILTCPGMDSIAGAHGAEVVAGMNVVGYVARQCARKGAKLIVAVLHAVNIPMTEEIVKNAYTLEGVPYDPSVIRFIPYGPPYDAAVQGIAQDERPAAGILIGPTHHPILLQIEALAMVGAMNINGTVIATQAANCVAGSDYSCVGDEVLACGAFASGDTELISSIAGLDYFKFIMLSIVAVGTLFSLAGIDFLYKIIVS